MLLDYNQNAWGGTLALVYSVRPTEVAGASAPVTWEEVERGFEIADFRLKNLPARVGRRGDLWKPRLSARGASGSSSFCGAFERGGAASAWGGAAEIVSVAGIPSDGTVIPSELLSSRAQRGILPAVTGAGRQDPSLRSG